MTRKGLYKVETKDCGSYHVVAVNMGEAAKAVVDLLSAKSQYISEEGKNVVGVSFIDMELSEDEFALKEANVEGASLIIVV